MSLQGTIVPGMLRSELCPRRVNRIYGCSRKRTSPLSPDVTHFYSISCVSKDLTVRFWYMRCIGNNQYPEEAQIYPLEFEYGIKSNVESVII